MGWQLFTDPATHNQLWVDTDKAGKWAARLVALTSPAEIARLDGVSWLEQQQAVIDAWTALQNYFLALDLRAYAQPYVVINAVKYWGPTTGTDPSSARSQTINHLQLAKEAFAKMISDPSNSPLFVQWLESWWTANGNNPLNPLGVSDFRVRINLTDTSMVSVSCISPSGVHDPQCDFGGISGGCSNAPGQHGCEVQGQHYDWHTLAWNAPPYFPGGAGNYDGPGLGPISPPLRWSMLQLAELAGNFGAQSPFDTVAQACRWATASNIAQAANANILPADLASVNSQLIAQYNSAVNVQRVAIAGFGAAIGTLVGIVTVNPAVGGVVAGVLAALAAIAPIAVGCKEDLFGRCVPVLERIALTGTPTKQPTQVVQDPKPDPRDQTQYSILQSTNAAQTPVAPPPVTPATSNGAVLAIGIGAALLGGFILFSK